MYEKRTSNSIDESLTDTDSIDRRTLVRGGLAALFSLPIARYSYSQTSAVAKSSFAGPTIEQKLTDGTTQSVPDLNGRQFFGERPRYRASKDEYLIKQEGDNIVITTLTGDIIGRQPGDEVYNGNVVYDRKKDRYELRGQFNIIYRQGPTWTKLEPSPVLFGKNNKFKIEFELPSPTGTVYFNLREK